MKAKNQFNLRSPSILLLSEKVTEQVLVLHTALSGLTNVANLSDEKTLVYFHTVFQFGMFKLCLTITNVFLF